MEQVVFEVELGEAEGHNELGLGGGQVRRAQKGNDKVWPGFAGGLARWVLFSSEI